MACLDGEKKKCPCKKYHVSGYEFVPVGPSRRPRVGPMGEYMSNLINVCDNLFSSCVVINQFRVKTECFRTFPTSQCLKAHMSGSLTVEN
jgi:hypothetical protein